MATEKLINEELVVKKLEQHSFADLFAIKQQLQDTGYITKHSKNERLSILIDEILDSHINSILR